MSYLLKVATIDIIFSLHSRGWSQRQIARELDINRETVARYLKQASAASKPANAPPGSDISESVSKPANAPPGFDNLQTKPNHSDPPSALVQVASEQGIGRKSGCEPWRDLIQSMCEKGLSAQRVYQDLTTEHNFTGSYYSVRRFVHRCIDAKTRIARRVVDMGMWGCQDTH
jgi:transcriptional regulator with XRE-family HTH domain